MCGICGVVQIGGEPRQVVSPETIYAMTDAMAHRGPYDRGIHTAPGVALGARRLPLIDVERGHQPFSNEDGSVWGALNGMLYNHNELREELRADGHVFRSRCDTEIIPHLYERDGTTFQSHLRGEFGIAVWDAGNRRAVLARDRLGAKPLYWSLVGDLVVFATELKSLLASGIVPLDLDHAAIYSYLTLGFFPAPYTPLAAVSKLLPGHRLVVDRNGVREERYWDYPRPQPDSSLDEESQGERFLAAVEESVRLRLMSDVPLGAMLSGGLDSSVVVALMARNTSTPVKTFSVGFSDVGTQSELADARHVASALGTLHHELELSFADDTVDLVELVWHLDEPLPELSALGLLALSSFAVEDVTVALSGMGPDELLGGYAAHRTAALAGRWLRLPMPVRRLGERVVSFGPPRAKRAAAIVGAVDPTARFIEHHRLAAPTLLEGMVRGPLAEVEAESIRSPIAARLGSFSGDPLSTYLYLDPQLSMVDDMLHYIDRASMARSLDLRAPFLDHHVVELCATIPNGLKVRGPNGKYLLRKIARGLVPDQVLTKPKQGFFSLAIDAWLRSQLRGPLANFLLDSSPRYAELLDRAAVERLVATQLETKTSDIRPGKFLLSILMLEIWLSTYLPRATTTQNRPPVRDAVEV